MTVLVTGGSGYIGSHVVRLLQQQNVPVVIADDFVTGEADRVAGVPFVNVDLASDAAIGIVRDLVREHGVDAVIHFAARKQVAESVARPAWYYSQNVGSLSHVLEAIEGSPVRRFVFSSSAAVYGSTVGDAISEDAPTKPINPYGATKLVGEDLLAAAAAAQDIATVSLRYFNVAGAGWPDLGDRAVLNLVPMVFERIDAGLPPLVFGDDYPTSDGTCVRDYIHVLDLAEAHLAALDYLGTVSSSHLALNVGTGTGTSVRELIAEISRVAEYDREPEVAPRRPGDPAAVVAAADQIWDRLGWSSKLTVADMVQSAWESHLLHRNDLR